MRTIVLCPHSEPHGSVLLTRFPPFEYCLGSIGCFVVQKTWLEHMFHVRMVTQKRLTRRVSCPCGTLPHVDSWVRPDLHLLLPLTSFDTPSLILICSRHISSQFAAGTLPQPIQWLTSLAWTKDPLWRIVPVGHDDGTGCCPGLHPSLVSPRAWGVGGQPSAFRQGENPDFAFPEWGLGGWCVKVQISFWQVGWVSSGLLSKWVAGRVLQWHSAFASLKTDSPALSGIWPNEVKWALGNDQLRVLSRIEQELWIIHSLSAYRVPNAMCATRWV